MPGLNLVYNVVQMLALLMIFLLSSPAPAESYDLQSKPKVRLEGEEKVEPGVETHAEEDKPDAAIGEPGSSALGRHARRWRGKIKKPAREKANVSWGGQLTYGVRTDLADEVTPRVYTHSLGLSYGFQHLPSKISIIGVVAAVYESTGDRGGEILVDEDRAELFVNDFSLAAQVEWDLGFWKSNLMTTLANEFPTSPDAQREGYGSVTSFEAMWTVPLVGKRLSASAISEIYYVWNSFEYSPATLELNKQGGGRLAGSLRWKIYRGLYVSGSVGSQTSRYLDGTTDVTYRNSVTLGYGWDAFSVFVSTSNGSYLDREEGNIWFIDDYRRTLAMGMGLSF